MSTPYDLDTPEPEQRPGEGQAGGNTTSSSLGSGSSSPTDLGQHNARASDILRDHPLYTKHAPRTNNINGGERGATRFDEIAQGILAVALIVVVLCLGYLLYGLWGGFLAEPNYTHGLTHADRLRYHGDVDTAFYVLKIALFIAIAALFFLFYHEESAGYILLAVVLLLDLGIPFATGQIQYFDRQRPSVLTNIVLAGFRALAWLPGIPGGLLIAYDVFRRITGGLEEAQIRRTTLRYGQGVSRQSKHKNVFLGACWNTPFCRDSIRARCPIFLQKKGPCWRHKRGCMCEESIILQAQSGDWKQRVAGAVGQIEGQKKSLGGALLGNANTGPLLTMDQKKERCRQCVIYNKHEEQKYKLLVAITFAVVIIGVVLLSQNLINLVNTVTTAADTVMGRFAYSSSPVGNTPAGVAISPSDATGPLAWVILGVITLIILSKLLQLVEYCCFKIKI
jgi:hypothetical protein